MDSLQKVISELEIGVYFGEHSKEELDLLDVIVSTVRSAGVGSDIKGLRTVILIDSFRAEHWCRQVPGRLRELESSVPEFVYLQNRELSSHRFHGYSRRKIFKELTDNFKHINLY